MFKPYGKGYVYTEDELDEMVEILIAAEDIKKDDKVYRMVLEHMEEKSNKIDSIKKLRDRANMPSDDGDEERKTL